METETDQSEHNYSETIPKLVTTRPEAEVAADLKLRIEEALGPVCKLIDEAAGLGLLVQWDSLSAGPPTMRSAPRGLRLVKHY